MSNRTFTAKLEGLPQMMSFIMQEAGSLGFADKDIHNIQLAAEEALVNVIHYAYPDKEGELQVSVDLGQGKQLEIVIIDQGIAFNPLSLPEPDLNAPLEERKIGGLGVYLIRKLMDEVSYKRDNDSNILRFVKKV